MVSSIKGVHELVVLCKMHGVKHVVVSPGSRNAPLSITFENTNDLRTYVVVDERSAAFFALGISLALDQPVAIVCTSGSAVLNYAPAISEAYYQKIPLIVITADRPQEWVNQGDGQTIMQDGIYGKHVLHSVTLPVIENNDTDWLFNRLVNESLLKANGKIKGPVHINIPFKEPLYLTEAAVTDLPRKIEFANTKSALSTGDQDTLVKLINRSKKVLLLIGQTKPDAKLNSLIQYFADLDNCVVLSETTSNMSGKNIISTIDRVIDGFSGDDKINFAPDILITGGDAIVSKKVKAWIRNSKPKEHLHIGIEHHIVDTYSCLTHLVELSFESFFEQVNPLLKSNGSDYSAKWNLLAKNRGEKHDQFINKCEWSDLKAFEIITHSLPHCNLHLGNSSPIRYVQLFDMNANVKYYSNRGTSGIDGSTSTVAGFASVNKDLNVLISGDISFYYDSNALWNQHLKGNFKIILINNKGGNIFRIIDGPTEDKITEKYFEAKQEMNAEYLCKQFGLEYSKAYNENELKNSLVDFLKITDKPGVLEIFTDNIISPQMLKDYFNYLKS